MRKSKKLLKVLAISSALFVSCAPDVSGYKGDGAISPIRFILNPGVRVELGSFDLSEPFDRTYSIQGLPSVPDQIYLVSLLVYEPGELRIQTHSPIRFGLPGELELEVRTRSGRQVFKEKWSPEQTGWSAEGPPAVAVAATPQTVIPAAVVTSGDPPQSIRVSWAPGAEGMKRKATLRLRAGGGT